MSLLKLRYLFIFLVLALLLSIWTGRTQLSGFAVESAMQGYGLENVTAEISRLGPGRIHMPRFGFTLATETGLLQLAAYDVSMDYDLEQLIQGRVQNLAVKRLEFHHVNTGESSDTTQDIDEVLEPIKIFAVLRHALREYSIFNTFSVKQLVLEGESFGMLQGKSFHLNGTHETGTTHAVFSLQEQAQSGRNEEIRQLVINKLTEDSLSAELRFSASQTPAAAGLTLNIGNTTVDGVYHIEPGRLMYWLQPFTHVAAGKKIKRVNGTFASSFESDTAISSTITARLEEYAFKNYSAANITLELKLVNSTRKPIQQVSVQSGSFLKAGHIEYKQFSLNNTRINMVGTFSTSAGAWQYAGNMNTGRLEPVYDSRTLPLKDITAHLSASAGNLQADGNFSTANVPGQFAFALAHDIDKEHGRLSVKPLKPIDLNAEDSKLSQLLSPWNHPFDILTGKIALTSSAAWSQNSDFRLSSRLVLDDAGGHYRELVFSGLSFDHAFEILPEVHSIEKSMLHLKHLDSGVIVSNISTDLSLETASTGPLPQLAIRNLHGVIFDGSFSGDDFVFDMNRSNNSFKIRATDIDLAQIVETQQLEDLVVTGRIDGTIPVEITQQGIFIQHGAFVNKVRAGTIRYRPAAGTDQLKQNPLTGIALDALRDFRYSHLSADVNFTPEGMLTINLQLKGTSPELDTRRPVHLNINTEQNLLSLLKSLRYAQGVSERIDKKVRRQYKKNQKQ